MEYSTPAHHELYFKVAQSVATRATCLRARCGAAIVSSEGKVIGVGFNAPPLYDEAQRMCSNEYDVTVKPKSDKTCCVHAEWNAILDAAMYHGSELKGSTLYFMRVDDNGEVTDAGEPYCTVCSRLALQSGVEVFGLWENGPRMIPADEYNRMSYNYHV